MSKTVKVYLIFQKSFSAKHEGGFELSGAEFAFILSSNVATPLKVRAGGRR